MGDGPLHPPILGDFNLGLGEAAMPDGCSGTGRRAILCGKHFEAGRTAMQTMTPQQEFQRTLLELLPAQGSWSDEGYLWLTGGTNRLIEFTDGYIEVLPMPTPLHQNILQFLFLTFLDYIHPRGGKVHFAPLRL